ncbi:MAG: hypothetical protein QOG75_5628 [Mycobacterium sp.]|nr:hypothetical protein [Mycobacterium sp.]
MERRVVGDDAVNGDGREPGRDDARGDPASRASQLVEPINVEEVVTWAHVSPNMVANTRVLSNRR